MAFTTQLPTFSIFLSELSFPRFAEPIPNITVTIGRDALLGCVVDNLKNYKVSCMVYIRFVLLIVECKVPEIYSLEVLARAR